MKVKIADLRGTHLDGYAQELEALAEEMRNQSRGGKSIKKLGFQMGRVMRRIVEDTRGAENTSQ